MFRMQPCPRPTWRRGARARRSSSRSRRNGENSSERCKFPCRTRHRFYSAAQAALARTLSPGKHSKSHSRERRKPTLLQKALFHLPPHFTPQAEFPAARIPGDVRAHVPMKAPNSHVLPLSLRNILFKVSPKGATRILFYVFFLVVPLIHLLCLLCSFYSILLILFYFYVM